MYKQEYILKNEIQEVLMNFARQTDHLILARRPDLVIINKNKKENLPSSGFSRSSEPQRENKKDNINKYLDLAWELKKTVVHKGEISMTMI